MQQFTGWQYLLIDLANHFGLDKLTFDQRIAWAEDNLHQLEQLSGKADCQPLYDKAVMTIRRVQDGYATGHLVGFDACCSGIQIMSVLTGCVTGATNTGLVDPDVRADAYGKLQETMQAILGPQFNVARAPAKQALMTVFYGSREQPKQIFGEDTPELAAFYQAAQAIAPGAWELLQDLLGSWQDGALMHAWQLPDGFEARVKVMVKKEARIEVDELDHATFTYEFYENTGVKKGARESLANAANVVHSVDGYVLRSIHRRCNYDEAMVREAYGEIIKELALRDVGGVAIQWETSGKTAYYLRQYARSGMPDVVILPHLIESRLFCVLTTRHLQQLKGICESMLRHKPFPVVGVHDEFKCHPNHMNWLRAHYVNILAELAESELLSDILSQIHGKPGVFHKLSPNLGQLIRGSNYALS